MKKLLLSATVLLLAAGLSSFILFKKKGGTEEGKVKWYTLEEALKLNKEHPKRIFMDMYTDWCGWCKRMEATTFTNATIAKYMNDNFYPVRFNAEQRDSVVFNGQTFKNNGVAGSRTAHDFAVAALQGHMSYPSFVFISDAGTNKTTFTIMQGYMTPEQIEPYLHYYVDDKSKTTTYDTFLSTFKSELPATTTTTTGTGTTTSGH